MQILKSNFLWYFEKFFLCLFEGELVRFSMMIVISVDSRQTASKADSIMWFGTSFLRPRISGWSISILNLPHFPYLTLFLLLKQWFLDLRQHFMVLWFSHLAKLQWTVNMGLTSIKKSVPDFFNFWNKLGPKRIFILFGGPVLTEKNRPLSFLSREPLK